MPLSGIVPVTITPMKEDGSPDVQGHERFYEFLLKYPFGGFWSLGSAGECFLMTYEDRVRTAKIITELVGGKVPVLMGAEDASMRNVLRFFDDTSELPLFAYDAIPRDVHMNDKALIQYYTYLAERCPKPLWLYHNIWRGCGLPFDVVRELSQHPNITGMKAGGVNIPELARFSTLDSDEFQVIGAGGGQAVQLLSMGLRAHTASPASCFPDKMCEIFDLWSRGKCLEAVEAQKRFNAMWRKIPVPAENSETSAHEKGVLEALGICSRHVAPHFRPMTDEEMGVIRQVLKEEGYL